MGWFVLAAGLLFPRLWPFRGAKRDAPNPLSTRRGFLAYLIATWAFAMIVGVLGVGLYVHASAGAFTFGAALITVGIGLGGWFAHRMMR